MTTSALSTSAEGSQEKVGEKRSPLDPTNEGETSEEPQEKKPKLNDAPAADANDNESKPEENQTESSTKTEEMELGIPPAEANDNDLAQLQLSPSSLAEVQANLMETPTAGIPLPPGYDAAVHGTFIAAPLTPVQAPRKRRNKSELLTDAFQDPESKWSVLATERLLDLYADFGKRRILDEKLRNEIITCLEHNGNPAVTLMSADGTSFFTYLTVASECGDLELVKKFLTEYREEFSEYDFKASLHAAIRNREQEIAEYLLKETDVVPDREAVIEMFDIAMSDDLDRKVAPLKAFIDRCIDTGKYPAEDFFISEILNRAIYANNVAALEVLFERKKEEFLPLLEHAKPDENIIRAGRGKAQDIGEGVPPLVYAALMERPDCLEVFLRAGANPNFLCNDMGGTLLHIVGQKGNTEMTELLIEYNADPRIRNAQGVDALTRTKGRKARKCITDAMARFNQSMSGIPMPSGRFSNNMGADHSASILSGDFNMMHPSNDDISDNTMPMPHGITHPPPFANRNDNVLDIQSIPQFTPQQVAALSSESDMQPNGLDSELKETNLSKESPAPPSSHVITVHPTDGTGA